jgi:hypothetical protein
MTKRSTLIATIGVLGLGLGCQGQVFDPEAAGMLEAGKQQMVVAQPEALDIMLVVDTSGSMMDPVVEGSTTTRWDNLRAALLDPETGFLGRNRERARFGLTTFPDTDSGTSCSPGTIQVPMGLAAGDNVEQIGAVLRAVNPFGGTPTTTTLALLDDSTFPPAEGRLRLAVLLTDGLPNCNATPGNAALCDQCNLDPSACHEPVGCRPTFGDSTSCEISSAPPGAACLDDQNLVAQIDSLRAQGIETVILGFGAETRSLAAMQVLNLAAVAGGWAREGDRSFYQAEDESELTEALDQALRPARCVFSLDRTLDAPESAAVTFVPPGAGDPLTLQRGVDWALRGPTELQLLDSRCEKIDSYVGYQMQVRWTSRK